MTERLRRIVQALASVERASPEAIEHALGCTLSAISASSYTGTMPELDVREVDLRLGETAGVVVLYIEESAQVGLAEARASLGPPDGVDVPSPPLFAFAGPWPDPRSEHYTVDDVTVALGLETCEGADRLVYASRPLGARTLR